MKTKVVYSVISDETDFYLTQALMSIYTLKKYNPEVSVLLVTDEKTKASMTGKRTEILKYLNDVICVDIPCQYNKVKRSRYLKTSLREHVLGDYLFIDTDTIVCSSLSDIDQMNCDIGATADKHVCIGNHPMKVYIKECSQAAGFTMRDDVPYFNSGVMYVKDNEITHMFYEEWHKTWLQTVNKGIVSDQASLAKANEKLGFVIKDIGGEWNCQLEDNGLKYMDQAKILHYFASTAKKEIKSPFTYYQASVYDRIRESGGIPEDVKNIIMNPKQGFLERCRIIANDDLNYMTSPIHRLFVESPKLYNYLVILTRLLLKFT